MQQIAREKAEQIEKEFQNLTTTINAGSQKASYRTTSQKQAIEKIHKQMNKRQGQDDSDDSQVTDEEVFANSRLNREQVNVDLRAVKPSLTSIKVIDKDQKKIKYQSQQLLEKIEAAEAKEKWHRDMQIFERVKGLLDTP